MGIDSSELSIEFSELHTTKSARRSAFIFISEIYSSISVYWSSWWQLLWLWGQEPCLSELGRKWWNCCRSCFSLQLGLIVISFREMMLLLYIHGDGQSQLIIRTLTLKQNWAVGFYCEQAAQGEAALGIHRNTFALFMQPQWWVPSNLIWIVKAFETSHFLKLESLPMS